MTKTGYGVLLRREMTPSAGCTEPSAVALAAAAAAELLGLPAQTLRVEVSPYLYKNGMHVGLPGMDGECGLSLAAALGAQAADMQKGMLVLGDLSAEQREAARAMVRDGGVKVATVKDTDRVYAGVTATAGAVTARAVIAGRHDSFVLFERDGIERRPAPAGHAAPAPEAEPLLSVRSIYEYCRAVSLEELAFLDETVEMNTAIAREGLKDDYGLRIGKNMMVGMENGMLSEDVANRAIATTAAAADARMAGCDKHVMSTAGSGNQGLTATLPVIVTAREMNVGRGRMLRALALSALITLHTKRYIGRLSALCGCGVSAGIGTCCGLIFLWGGDLKQIGDGVHSMVADISGMVCDGAKPGCSLKIATSISSAFRAAWLAHMGVGATEADGIVDRDVEKTLENLGALGEIGMKDVNDSILEMLLSKHP